MRKYLYTILLAAKSAARRSRLAGGAIVLFAATAALAVALDAVASGAERNARAFFESRSGGQVFVRGLERVEGGRLVEEGRRAELEGLVAALPRGSRVRERCDFRARLLAHGRSAVATVRGLDLKAEKAAAAGLELVSGSLPAEGSGGIVIEERAALALRAAPGDELVLQTLDHRGRATADAFRIAAVVRDGAMVADGSAWLELAAARRLRGYGPGELHYLAIGLPEGEATRGAELIASALPDPLKGKLRKELPWDEVGARVEGLSWSGRRYLLIGEEDCTIFILRAVDGIRLAIAVLLSLILCLGAVGSSSSFGMIALDRRREIGALRAIGLDRRQAARLLGAEAIMTAAAAALAGIAAGCALVAPLAFLRLSGAAGLQGFLAGASLAPEPRAGAALAALAATTLAAALGAVGPARRAAGIDPAKAFGEGV